MANKKISKDAKPLSPRQFAAKHGKSHSTVAAWLRAGHIPSAESINTPSGIVWAIPENAPLPEPKIGRPKGSKNREKATKATRKGSNAKRKAKDKN